MYELISVDVADAVATLRLDRPPMNVLDTAMQEEIRAAATDLSTRADVRAVVLWGGPKVFAAGADVKEFAAMSHADMVNQATRLSSSVDAVARIP